jgi:hypothetical protein
LGAAHRALSLRHLSGVIGPPPIRSSSPWQPHPETAKVLGDLGRHGNRETPVVLSILVLEDLAMAAYLPVVTVLLAGGTLASSLLPAILALAAVTAVLAATLRYGTTLSRLVFTPNDEVLLLKILGVALLVAGAAQAAQVSAAVGAFLVGIALSGPAAHGARALLSPCVTCSPRCSSCSSGCRPTRTSFPRSPWWQPRWRW